ncbi:hypothetical protein EVAR_100225_1 [Eumeta japonica]|uniref:Uncharacterized protein n=1 Tax=Eumeta variegata TaxID=151549 RepID=A0A4C1SZR5_EUMVA|nr:hypothetical protein EVAR_100225_1 [Eumeta japonica]
MDSRESSWILRPFSTCVDIFKDEDVLAKVEFLGLRENNSLKVDFQNDKLGTFWRKAAAEYPIIADRALKCGATGRGRRERCERCGGQLDGRGYNDSGAGGDSAARTLECGRQHSPDKCRYRNLNCDRCGATGTLSNTDTDENELFYMKVDGKDDKPCACETVRSLGFITARSEQRAPARAAAACPAVPGRPPLLGRSWMLAIAPVFTTAVQFVPTRTRCLLHIERDRNRKSLIILCVVIIINIIIVNRKCILRVRCKTSTDAQSWSKPQWPPRVKISHRRPTRWRYYDGWLRRAVVTHYGERRARAPSGRRRRAALTAHATTPTNRASQLDTETLAIFHVWVGEHGSGADALSCLPLSSDTLAKRVSGDGNFRTKAARADGRDAPEIPRYVYSLHGINSGRIQLARHASRAPKIWHSREITDNLTEVGRRTHEGNSRTGLVQRGAAVARGAASRRLTFATG